MNNSIYTTGPIYLQLYLRGYIYAGIYIYAIPHTPALLATACYTHTHVNPTTYLQVCSPIYDADGAAIYPAAPGYIPPSRLYMTASASEPGMQCGGDIQIVFKFSTYLGYPATTSYSSKFITRHSHISLKR